MEIQSIVLKAIKIIILAYLGLVILVYFFQEKIIFYPTLLPQDFKFPFKGNFEEEVIDSGDLKIHSLLFKAPNSKGLIIYFHGNGGAMESWGEVASDISDKLSWDVWMVDYPGYGKSTGKIKSQEQLLKMARDIFKAAQKEYPNQKIVLYGRSLGSGLAVKLASENEVTGLVLETPYLSLEDVGKSQFPWLPSFIMRYPMQSKEWITEVKVPVLFVHGNQDEVVPFNQGLELSKIAKKSTFVEIAGGHHNDLAMYKEYWMAVGAYLGGL